MLREIQYILGNKTLEDKLQKAAGERHSNVQKGTNTASKRDEPQKRKLDDVDLTFASGPPAPQLSYERSRPQTPAATPSRDMGHSVGASTMAAPALPSTSPQVRQPNDTLMGGLNSRSVTRPPTPFNPSFSIPGSPPDLFLVTRSSPPISQNIWENFQPDQLFPDNSSSLPLASLTMSNLDPQLARQLSQGERPSPILPHTTTPPLGQLRAQAQAQAASQSGQRSYFASQGIGSPIVGVSSGEPGPQSLLSVPTSTANVWPNQQFESMDLTGNSPDDSSSSNTSSRGLIVPATLNMDDWYETRILLLDPFFLALAGIISPFLHPRSFL